MNKKVASVIFMDEKYREARPFYAKNSVNSFKKWHPDVDLDVVGNDFDLSKMQNTEVRMQFVKQKFDDGYTKVIMLGADTITCSRMDEFLDDDVTPFLATCDSKMPFSMKFEPDCFFSPKHGVFEWAVINSDVCCFNNKEVIYVISRYIDIENDWHEQSSMTYITFTMTTRILVTHFEFYLVAMICIVETHMYFM